MSVDMPPLCSSLVEEFLCWCSLLPQATIWDVSLTPELHVCFGTEELNLSLIGMVVKTHTHYIKVMNWICVRILAPMWDACYKESTTDTSDVSATPSVSSTLTSPPSWAGPESCQRMSGTGLSICTRLESTTRPSTAFSLELHPSLGWSWERCWISPKLLWRNLHPNGVISCIVELNNRPIFSLPVNI